MKTVDGGMSARLAATFALACSILALVVCTVFVPLLVAKIGEITKEVKNDILEFDRLQSTVWEKSRILKRATGRERVAKEKNEAECFCEEQNKCPPGAPGDPGPPGLDGQSGLPGSPGLAGMGGNQPEVQIDQEENCRICPIGQPGYPGPRGPQGEDGLPGMQGRPGTVGPNGPPGKPGRVGKVGPMGLAGKRGKAGNRGMDGFLTARGIPGPKGLSGDRGPPGMEGMPGMPGQPGIQGQPGLPGPPGDEGDQGTSGGLGTHGIDHGIPGVDVNYCPCPKRTGPEPLIPIEELEQRDQETIQEAFPEDNTAEEQDIEETILNETVDKRERTKTDKKKDVGRESKEKIEMIKGEETNVMTEGEDDHRGDIEDKGVMKGTVKKIDSEKVNQKKDEMKVLKDTAHEIISEEDMDIEHGDGKKVEVEKEAEHIKGEVIKLDVDKRSEEVTEPPAFRRSETYNLEN